MDTVKLKHPLRVKSSSGTDVEVSTLTFSRPKTKHLRHLPKEVLLGTVDKVNPVELLPFIAAVTGLQDAEADEIDLEDLTAVVEKVGELLGKSLSQQTGES